MTSPRIIELAATRQTDPVQGIVAHVGNAVTFRVIPGAKIGAVSGALSLVAELRRGPLDTINPLAAVTIPTPSGAGPFDFEFNGARMNQDLDARASAGFWLVVYATWPGELPDVWLTAALTLRAHGASQEAESPPVVGTLITAEEVGEQLAPLVWAAAKDRRHNTAEILATTPSIPDLERAIEAGIAASVSDSGGEVLIPNGVYDLTSPFRPTHSKDGRQHYAQIVLPAVAEGVASGVVTIRGETPASIVTNYFSDGLEKPMTGVILRGRVRPVSPGWNYSLIGSAVVPGTLAGNFWNYQTFHIGGLTFRPQSIVSGVHVDPEITAGDFSALAMVRIFDCRFDTESPAELGVDPMGGESNGVRMPGPSNWIESLFQRSVIEGFRHGLTMAEHCHAVDALISGCGWAVHAVGSHHPMYFHGNVNWCRHVLQCTGEPVIYGRVEIESHVGSRWHSIEQAGSPLNPISTLVANDGSAAPRGQIWYSHGRSAGGYPERSLGLGGGLDMSLLKMVNLRDTHGVAEVWTEAGVNITLNGNHALFPVRLVSGVAGNVFVPHLKVGTPISIYNAGTGVKTLTPLDANVRLTAAAGKLAMAQGEKRVLRCVAAIGADTYVDIEY